MHSDSESTQANQYYGDSDSSDTEVVYDDHSESSHHTAYQSMHSDTSDTTYQPSVDPCACVDTNNFVPIWQITSAGGEDQHFIEVEIPEEGTFQYVPNYGTTTCMAWDSGLEPFCDADAESPPDYCDRKWCYVSQECGLSDVTQSEYNELNYFSYLTCGAEPDNGGNGNCCDCGCGDCCDGGNDVKITINFAVNMDDAAGMGISLA